MAQKLEKWTAKEHSGNPIPDAVHWLRKQLDLSQGELATLLRVSTNAVARWEMGERQPDKWLLMFMLMKARPPLTTVFEEMIGRTKEEVLRDFMPVDHAQPDPYEELFKNLREIIDSGQSQLVGQAEDVLSRLADDARHMTQKKKSGKR